MSSFLQGQTFNQSWWRECLMKRATQLNWQFIIVIASIRITDPIVMADLQLLPRSIHNDGVI